MFAFFIPPVPSRNRPETYGRMRTIQKAWKGGKPQPVRLFCNYSEASGSPRKERSPERSSGLRSSFHSVQRGGEGVVERGDPVAGAGVVGRLGPVVVLRLDVADVAEQGGRRGEIGRDGTRQRPGSPRLGIPRRVEGGGGREQERVVIGTAAAVLPAVVGHAFLHVAQAARWRLDRGDGGAMRGDKGLGVGVAARRRSDGGDEERISGDGAERGGKDGRDQGRCNQSTTCDRTALSLGHGYLRGTGWSRAGVTALDRLAYSCHQ